VIHRKTQYLPEQCPWLNSKARPMAQAEKQAFSATLLYVLSCRGVPRIVSPKPRPWHASGSRLKGPESFPVWNSLDR
jgi:hypothetical protein